jgi:hypothetical protein
MSRRQIAVIVFLLIILSVTADYVNLNYRYVPFRVVYLVGEELTVSEEPLPPVMMSNIRVVLTYYQVPFREDSQGNVLIPLGVWQDRELMWNYTTKANDPEWLSQR